MAEEHDACGMGLASVRVWHGPRLSARVVWATLQCAVEVALPTWLEAGRSGGALDSAGWIAVVLLQRTDAARACSYPTTDAVPTTQRGRLHLSCLCHC